MNETNEKYLARLLEGAEQGLQQVEQAIEQINTQLGTMQEQRDEMEVAVKELKELLGLEEEKKRPQLLVEEKEDPQ